MVIGLALYRKLVSGGELDVLHVREAEAALIPRQEFRARRLDWIDHWGKLTTVTTVAFGFLIAVVYLIRLWQANNRASLLIDYGRTQSSTRPHRALRYRPRSMTLFIRSVSPFLNTDRPLDNDIERLGNLIEQWGIPMMN